MYSDFHIFVITVYCKRTLRTPGRYWIYAVTPTSFGQPFQSKQTIKYVGTRCYMVPKTTANNAMLKSLTHYDVAIICGGTPRRRLIRVKHKWLCRG